MKIIFTIIMFFTCAQGFAEPDTFNKKDLIEKMDRSDLEIESGKKVEIDDSILKFDIPKIEFETPVKKSQSSARRTTKSPKVMSKNTSSSKRGSEKSNPTKVKSVTKGKIKVVIAKRPILIGQINKNDKIVIRKGKTYVYRMTKSNIVQYRYSGRIPFDSKGLKKNDESSYYVIDKKVLLGDYKKSRSGSSLTKTKSGINKKKNSKAIKSSVVAKPAIKNTPVKKNKDIDAEFITEEILAQRKIIENKYNNGKRIKRTINLKNLHQNDIVYIVGNQQFVIRTSSNTSGKKKFWLLEKLDVTNKSVEKIGKNKYKIVRFYKTKQ